VVATANRRLAARNRLVAGGVVVAALAVIALGVTATLGAFQGNDQELPRVSNVDAVLDGTTVVFSWNDPGLQAEDSYEVTVAGGAQTFQRTTEFAVAASAGERVCITVRVARDGRLGSASDEKCAEVASG
jgi:archaellum component FlaF (FlaF/FlaG flagellin family)